MKPKIAEILVDSEYLAKEWSDFTSAFSLINPAVFTNSYPDSKVVFRALNECKPEEVKVVILGMDPFHDGSANGLAFDNLYDQKRISPSLLNIMKEIREDVPQEMYLDVEDQKSHLAHLPTQGVLLLNTALTVHKGKAGSHTELWKPFTTQLLTDIQKLDNIVWILWGNHAKSFKPLITNTSHYIIEGGHPSPLNRSVPFAGGKYFSECNGFLRTISKPVIRW